jgi:hypothetical protein
VVGTKNATNGELTELYVSFGAYRVNGTSQLESGGINAGWAFAHGLPYAVTDTAVVTWTSADRMKHSKEVNLKQHLPEDLNGVCISFIIGEGDAVDVKMLPWAEWQTWRR